ncbi:MAG: molecular chaperone HtpG [Candidatus Omnitrophica bacterium]|nr:molecular chaperone HtpG [Candidatus Omnitrophota bacterium]
MAQMKKVDSFEYKAEMKQLLNIIIHSLYTHPEVFLRELISNASDALNKVRFRELTDRNIIDPEVDLDIRIEVDSKKETFSIEDSGIGMTREELINNIGTVARSGTTEFLEKIKKENKAFDENLIGQFGVGFYAVFMAADEVTIETRNAEADSPGLRWRSKGESAFTIEEIDRKKRGTKIYFKLKSSAKEFAQEYKVKEIINKYSNFADFPILLKGEKINKISALWRKKSAEIKENEAHEFYKFITNDFEDPLGYLHLDVEGAVSFTALLFIPKQAPYDLWNVQKEKSLHLYSNKIMIQNDCKEILPEYLRFTKGVVDTLDLPLNVSRETVQVNPVLVKIRSALTRKILQYLADMADKTKDKYETFYKNFSPLLKSGLNSDFNNRDKIIDLLRFESSLKKPGELISLKDYAARMQKNQKEIYFICGEHRLSIEKNPNLEYFKKKGIEVLFLIDPIDAFVMPSVNEFDKHPLKSIEKADIALDPEDKIETPDINLNKSLLSLFKKTLGDRVEDVVSSKRLVDSAATLVVSKDAMDSHTERMMKMMNKDFHGAKKIMEVNTSHALISNLSRLYLADENNPLLKQCVEQLYEGVLLAEGNLGTPADFVKRMTDIMEAATNNK